MRTKTAKANVTPVRQRTQYSCMSASMAMCLRALDHDVTEDEVNRVMGARPMKGAAWEQALACAQHYGCRATLTMPSTVEQLKAWTDRGIPIMIAWNPEGRDWSHASVVFDVDDDLNVYVADPNLPNPKKTVRVVSEDEFYGKWYEKFPDYLVRRPACAIEREVTVEGRQVMASNKQAGGSRQDRQLEKDWSSHKRQQRQDKADDREWAKAQGDKVLAGVSALLKGYAVQQGEDDPVLMSLPILWSKQRSKTYKSFESLLKRMGVPQHHQMALQKAGEVMVRSDWGPWNLKKIGEPFRSLYKLKDRWKKPAEVVTKSPGAPKAPKDVVDSGSSQKIQILEILAGKVSDWPEGLAHVEAMQEVYRKGRNPSPDDLKKLRNYLYKNRMRDEANHFRQAKMIPPRGQQTSKLMWVDGRKGWLLIDPQSRLVVGVPGRGFLPDSTFRGPGNDETYYREGDPVDWLPRAERMARSKKKKKPESAKTKSKTKAQPAKLRDPNSRARAEQPGSGGAGAHMTRERARDYAKGRSRKTKHPPDWKKATDRLARRFVREAASDFWTPIKDGWKHVDKEILAYLTWEVTYKTVKDRNIPPFNEIADPEMLADGIPDLMKEYGDLSKEYSQWERQGWWPRRVRVPKGGLQLMIIHRSRNKTFEAHFKANELRKAQQKGEQAVEVIRGNKYPRWMKPMKLGSYSGNPDGEPIYPAEVDKGEEHALSGGFDIMKRMQDKYLVEQGGEPRDNQETPVSKAKNGSAPTYQKYRDKGGKMPKDEWERKVLQTGPKTEGKVNINKALDKVLGEGEHSSGDISPAHLKSKLTKIQNRLKQWERVEDFVDGSKADHEKAVTLIKERLSKPKEEPKKEKPKTKDTGKQTDDDFLSSFGTKVRDRLESLGDGIEGTPEFKKLEKAWGASASDLDRTKLETLWRDVLRTHSPKKKARLSFDTPAFAGAVGRMTRRFVAQAAGTNR